MKTPRLTLTAAAVLVSFIAACEGDSVTAPGESTPVGPEPVNTLNAFYCKATPKTLSLACAPAPDPIKDGGPSYTLGLDWSDQAPKEAILIGGQNQNVKLTSSNVTNDQALNRFGFDVTVQNLRPQAIGTTDGTTTDSSLVVFFHSGPTTTGGSGLTTVFNPTGMSTFTGPGQPYFKYGQILTQNQISPAKNWILSYDETVTTFSFLLLVSANVKFPNGYIDVFASSTSVNAGATLQLQDSVRDALGVATVDQSETWSLSDSSKATINASGLLTGSAPGSVTVTATQGLKTGSMLVTVTGAAPDAINDSFTSLIATTLNGDLTANNGSGADILGNPAATVASFGGGSLGGTVTSNAAGASVALAGGTLTVNANGTFSLSNATTTSGTYTFQYRLTNAVSSDDATVTIILRRLPDAKDDALTGNTGSPLSGNLVTNNNGSGVDDVGDPAATLTGFGGGSLAGNTTTNAGGATVALAGGNLTVGTNGSMSLTSPTTGGVYTFRYRLTNTAGIDSATVTLNINAAPTAVVDSAASNSAPGGNWHTAFNTTLNTPSVTANDNLGFPIASVASFGGGTLGGTVTSNAAGSTATFDGHSLTLSANGSFTYTPKTGFTGYFTTSYRITNAGGSSDGLIKIAVGVRPTASNSTYGTTLLGNVGINTSTSTNTKVAATGDALVYNNVGATNGTGAVHSDGTYDFKPNAGFVSGDGTLVFTVTNGFGTTANSTVTLPVGATRVWFVAPGGSGDGRFGTPLGCMVGAAGCLSNLSLANADIIHIGSGTYASTGALTMTAAMRIIGQGATGTFNAATNANLTWPADAGAQPATGGARPVLNSSGAGVLTLNNGNTVRGVLIGNATTVSVTGSAVGNLTLGDAAIVNASGRAIDLSTSGTLAVALDSIVATGGTGNGISLASQVGTFTSGITKITNPSAIGINVTNSAGYSFGTTTISKSAGGVGVNLSTNSGTTTFSTLNITTSSGAGLVTSNAGTLSIAAGTVSATGGPAVDASNTTFSGAGLTSTSSSGSPTTGINLNTVSGTLALGSGSIATAAAEDFVVSGGAATISYGGNITNTANRSVLISGRTGGSVTLSGTISDTGTGLLVQNNTGGTISFTGTSKSLNTGANAAVTLTNNTGSTVNFQNGGLGITTTSGAGFTATGGGTVGVDSAAASNTVNSTSGGTAVNIANTTIGSNGVNFYSVNAAGSGTNGIILNTTGAGTFRVTGDGASDPANTTRGRTTAKLGGGTIAIGSGGSISGRSGHGISLTSNGPVILRNMVITGSASSGDGINASSSGRLTLDNVRITAHASDHGILGNTVAGLSMNHSEIDNNATTSGVVEGPDIWNVRLLGLTGVDTVRNSNIHHGHETVFGIINTSGVLSLTVTNSNITDTGTGAGGGTAMMIAANGSSNVTANFQGDSVNRGRARGIQVSTETAASASMNLTVNNSQFINNSIAIETAHGSSGSSSFNITNNNLQTNVAGSGQAINVNRLGSGSFNSFGLFSGTISGNTIGTIGITNSGSSAGSGIEVESNGSGGITRATISNNTIREVSLYGIYVAAVDGNVGGTTPPLLEARVASNTISNLNPTLGLDGINILSGALGTDDVTVCIDVVSNNSTGIRNGLRVRSSGLPTAPATVQLEGWDGTTARQTYFTNRPNTLVGGVAAYNENTPSAPGGFVAVASCTTP